MDFFLDPESGKPLTGQLYEQLRLAITKGRLLPGDQLVPSRQLADELGVSRHTVTTAYGRLVAEGYAEGRAGGGSMVATAWPAPAPAADVADALRPSPRFAGWSPYFRRPSYGFRVDLRPGLSDPALFPAAMWRRRVAAAVDAEHREYGDPAGRIRLRRAIAGWVARSRSVAAGEDSVVITSGTQHAIDLVARVLLEPGDVVAVEDPGYVPARRLFSAIGAQVAGVPVDDQGLIVELLPDSARIVYVTPSHQFPLGTTMSMPRRRALLRWAQQHDAAVIEDDYDTEFRYVDRPLEPLQALDTNGRVVYVGSFSKTFSPAVRLGFAVVPRPLVEPIIALRQLIDWHPPIAMQTALAGFIEDGLLDKHIRRSRRVYAERHRILTAALAGPLAGQLTARTSNAGLHVAALLREGLGEKEVLRAAARHGIATAGLHDCYHALPARPGLLIGFGAVSTAELPAALRMLDRALASQSPPR
ncbi:MAG TPA: PLP-dependent aminotransferase family protein [Streptosporangiaceae bacterium]|jgi:GntR family transcriptional regulator/MocR family aminotransferase